MPNSKKVFYSPRLSDKWILFIQLGIRQRKGLRRKHGEAGPGKEKKRRAALQNDAKSDRWQIKTRWKSSGNMWGKKKKDRNHFVRFLRSQYSLLRNLLFLLLIWVEMYSNNICIVIGITLVDHEYGTKAYITYSNWLTRRLRAEWAFQKLYCILLLYKFAWQKVTQPRSKGFSLWNLKGQSPGNEVAMD